MVFWASKLQRKAGELQLPALQLGQQPRGGGQEGLRALPLPDSDQRVAGQPPGIGAALGFRIFSSFEV